MAVAASRAREQRPQRARRRSRWRSARSPRRPRSAATSGTRGWSDRRLTGVTTVFAGLAAWIARPDSRTGGFLVAIGGLWFLGAFGYGEDQALVDLVGFPLQGWNDVLLVALLLALAPPGRGARRVVSHRRARGARRARPRAPPAAAAKRCHQLLLHPQPNHGRHRSRRLRGPCPGRGFAEAAFAIAALGILVVRWHAATGAARRTLGGLLAAGAATAALVTYGWIVTRVFSDPVEPSIGAIVLLDIVRVRSRSRSRPPWSGDGGRGPAWPTWCSH